MSKTSELHFIGSDDATVLKESAESARTKIEQAFSEDSNTVVLDCINGRQLVAPLNKIKYIKERR